MGSPTSVEMELHAGLLSIKTILNDLLSDQMDVSCVHGTEGFWREAVSRSGLRFCHLSGEKTEARQGVCCGDAVLQPRKHIHKVGFDLLSFLYDEIFPNPGSDPSSKEAYRKDWRIRKASGQQTMLSLPPRLQFRIQARSHVLVLLI